MPRNPIYTVVKTPGGKLVYQSPKKRASGPKCPVTGKRIQGIPHLRSAEYKRSRLYRNQRTVNLAYGGVLAGGDVRERIIRAFLVEEQKIVKKVLKIQKAEKKLVRILFIIYSRAKLVFCYFTLRHIYFTLFDFFCNCTFEASYQWTFAKPLPFLLYFSHPRPEVFYWD